MAATAAANAHIEAQRRLRQIIGSAVVLTWQQLGSYDEADVGRFLASVVPLIGAAQRQSVALTEAYLARLLGRPPLGVDPGKLIGAAVRNGATPQEVYRRPFVNVWTDLSKNVPWEDAVHSGQARATSAAEMDVALSSRATFQAVQESDDGIYGYRRVADSGACKFCRTVSGAYVKEASASPLHHHCGCSLEPLTIPHPRARYLPSGNSVKEDYAIHQHGELGAMITDPTYNFDGPGVVTH